MEVTCLQTKMEIKSTIQSTMVIIAEEGGYNVQLNPEHHGNHLHVEEGEDQVKHNPEHHDAHLHAEEGEASQTPPRTACGSPA